MTTADLRKLIEAATPVPWTPDPDEYAMFIFGRDGQGMVAEMRGHGSNLPSKANRDLIVALVNNAPRLLALWEAAERWLDAEAGSDPIEARHAAIRCNAAVRALREEPPR
jgi:hypothetical protein